MSEDKKDDVVESQIESVTKESAEATIETGKKSVFCNEAVSRILVTLLFGLIGWLSLWVFVVVVLVQFGFLLITGQLNINLKAFNGELADFLSDIIKYVSFQTDDKPFPFRSWSYGETTTNNKEATDS